MRRRPEGVVKPWISSPADQSEIEGARQTFLAQQVTFGDAGSHEGDLDRARNQEGRGARTARRMITSCNNQRRRDRDVTLDERARGERRRPGLQLPLRLEFAEWAMGVCCGNRRVRPLVAVTMSVIMVGRVRISERVQPRSTERNQPIEGQQP